MRFLRYLPAAAALLFASGAFGQNESAVSSAADESGTATTTSATTTPTSASTGTGTGTATSASASASSSIVPDPDADPATRCRQADIVRFPFCAPAAHDVWRTSGTYYVTWDNDEWDMNSTVFLTLNYQTPGKDGPVAGEWHIANALGFFTIVCLPPLLLRRGKKKTVSDGSDARSTRRRTGS